MNDASVNIKFGENLPTLEAYDNEEWKLMEKHHVEFFPNIYYDVILISTETPNFLDFLTLSLSNTKENEIDQEKISLDLEWENELCLFQFGFSKSHSVVIIRHPPGPGNEELFHFMKSHHFYAKGTHNDIKQLRKKFKIDISSFFSIEDIAKTRLVPYGHSENFMEMVRKFAGEPTAEFKDIKITKSNWEQSKLTKRQILYAAFDVVSLCECYPNFPPPFTNNSQNGQIGNIIGNRITDKINIQKKNKKNRIVNINFENRQKTRRNRRNNELIKTKQSVKFKRTPAKAIYGFIVRNYRGTNNLYDLKYKYFPNNNFLIDFCSIFEDILFVGTFEENNDILNVLHNLGDVTKIVKNNLLPIDATDGDVLFIRNISNKLIEKFNEFLYCFGTNHDFSINQHNDLTYIRIEPREATLSYRIRLFIDEFEYNNQKIIVTDFPYFLPKIRIQNLPQYFGKLEIESLFSDIGKIQNIEILRRQFDYQEQTAFVTFNAVEEAENAIKFKNHVLLSNISSLNHNKETFIKKYEDIDNKMTGKIELNIFRFTDEPHLRFMRRFELRDTDSSISCSKDVLTKYQKYGEIFQYFYDQRFHVGRIQFYDKKDAYTAAKAENSEMTEESRTIVIRDLAFTTTDEEILKLCSRFGIIQNIINRDINALMRFVIKEVTFSTNQAANLAKCSLGAMTINGIAIRVAVLNGGYMDVTDWKMRQRKHWIKLTNTKPNDNLFEDLKKYGKIVKFIYDKRQNVQIPNKNENKEDEDENENEKKIPKMNDQNEKIKNSFHARNENQSENVKNKDDTTFSHTDQNQNDYKDDEECFGDSYIMFKNFLSLQETGVQLYPTIEEFVNILNHDELMIENQIVDGMTLKETYENPDDSSTIRMAIVIDPFPENITENQFIEYLGEFMEYLEFVLDKSLTVNGKQRMVIVPSSRSMTNKIYSRLNEKPVIENEPLLKPVRMRFEDVPNSPKIKPKVVQIIKQESKKMSILIDPLPEGLTEIDIETMCAGYGNYSLTITKSAIVKDKTRAILHPLNCRAKKHVFRALSTQFNGEQMKPFRMFPCDIPPPL
ncbi:hypothetical protein TRFO_33659 [Tritrichomonas foetus]|uniref:RRM domain-containing protein n=1 Tax=Tritrichomonas foetus TaxID=1144522 RepID=A0A1J4JQK1_9EUKA|nr:hypothetical protein TRFO_33659 [Tritrichomonas foetus]|eukprot:OHS99797.1 hypothetical protein TRFO_33659 [Tritrichomonas foetus]